MVQLLLGAGAYTRRYANFPPIELVNRFAESAPTQPSAPWSLIARPGTSLLSNVGSAPVRGRFTHPGLFGGDLFVVEGEQMWRLSADADWNITQIAIGGVVQDNGNPTFAMMKGDGFEYLFVADGQNLQYYAGLSKGQATLTASAVSNGNEVSLDGVYYQWTSGSVDSGSPDGSSSDPWLVQLGGSIGASLENLFLAINGTGVPGTTYSTALTAHLTLEGWQLLQGPERLRVRAKAEGVAGNGLPVTVETGAGLSWNAGTTTGGGVHGLVGVPMPNDQAAGKVVALSGHVLVTVANSNRFFWIRPAETTIDSADNATVEANPGAIIDAVVYGDQVWFVKQASVEPFYGVETSAGANFVPVTARPFTRGGLEGTAMVLDDTLYLVGNDNVHYSVAGGIQRVSDHALEEKTRIARAAGAL